MRLLQLAGWYMRCHRQLVRLYLYYVDSYYNCLAVIGFLDLSAVHIHLGKYIFYNGLSRKGVFFLSAVEAVCIFCVCVWEEKEGDFLWLKNRKEEKKRERFAVELAFYHGCRTTGRRNLQVAKSRAFFCT